MAQFNGKVTTVLLSCIIYYQIRVCVLGASNQLVINRLPVELALFLCCQFCFISSSLYRRWCCRRSRSCRQCTVKGKNAQFSPGCSKYCAMSLSSNHLVCKWPRDSDGVMLLTFNPRNGGLYSFKLHCLSHPKSLILPQKIQYHQISQQI